jgi:hypothetical protein
MRRDCVFYEDCPSKGDSICCCATMYGDICSDCGEHTTDTCEDCPDYKTTLDEKLDIKIDF